MSVRDNQDRKFQYPSLNGLRAISILIVILHHLESRYHLISSSLPITLKPLYDIITDGQLGVNVFFIISGFLITLLLLEEERTKQTISLKNFYIRRTLRIFPAYYFYLLILLILHFFSFVDIPFSAWLTAITYTKYVNWGLDWFTAHAWSLSIEEHFYMLFPLIFMMGEKKRQQAVIALIVIVPLLKIYNTYDAIRWMNELTIFKRIDALALGCFIAFQKDRLLLLLRKRFKMLFYVALITIFLIGLLPMIPPELRIYIKFIEIPLGTRYGTIANISIGIILLYSVFGEIGLWFRFLNTKILNYIGLLSYSLYLWQQLFISGLPYWAMTIPQNLVLVVICALFSYYCIEKPFLTLKSKFTATN